MSAILPGNRAAEFSGNAKDSRARLEIEAGRAVDSVGGHPVDVAFTQQ